MIQKIIFQGSEGAFGDIAARKYFDATRVIPLKRGIRTKKERIPGPILPAGRQVGDDIIMKGVPTFHEVFHEVQKGKADYGVVPIENSVAGSIYDNIDLLSQTKLQIVGEVYIRVNLHLLINNVSLRLRSRSILKQIKKVYSHPKALEQCSEFLRNHPWMQGITTFDTAGSAKMVAQNKREDEAAVASEEAAKLYGLTLIKKNIENNHENYTRFVVIAAVNRHSGKPVGHIQNPDSVVSASWALPQNDKVYKMSLMFKLKHEPGTLYRAFGCLAKYNLNVTKIESRPLVGKPWEYLFYLDYELNNDFESALTDLKACTKDLHILGIYQKGEA